MDDSFCPIYASIELLQEKWTLHIIRHLLAGPSGFNELARSVGVNAVTLSARLSRLEELGVVRREVESVMPPKTRYELTEAGLELQGVVDAISQWGRSYLHKQETADT